MDKATRLVLRWELNHDVIDSRSRRARSAAPHVAPQVSRLALEVADIFRTHGPAWRVSQRGHLSLGQLKVMSAIEQCRSAALGGHALRCEGCGVEQVSYNSCLMVTVPLWGVGGSLAEVV